MTPSPGTGASALLCCALAHSCSSGSALPPAANISHEIPTDKDESLILGFDLEGWHIVEQSKDSLFQLTQWVPEGETDADWTERIVLQVFRKFGNKSPSPEEAMNALKKIVIKRCPDAAWTVIGRRKRIVVYEWVTEDCPSYGPQHQVAAFIDGYSHRYRIAYMIRKSAMPAAERELWVERIRRTRPKRDIAEF